MKQAGAPSSFWAEAINTACYIRNRCITKTTSEVPYKIWTNKIPTVIHMKVFGSKAYVLDKKPSKGKFDSRSEPCVFVGYSSESKAYRLYSKEKRNIIISREVKFINEPGFENEYYEIFEKEKENKDNEIEFEINEKIKTMKLKKCKTNQMVKAQQLKKLKSAAEAALKCKN